MSLDTTAAIWGAVAGGITGTLGSIVVLVVGRYLRRRGRLECEPRGWSLGWLMYRSPETEVFGEGRSEKTYYQRFRVDDFHPGVNFAEYTLEVELTNNADVPNVLRDARIAFLKDGGTLFEHRPFDAENSSDPSGVSSETSKELDGQATSPPGAGVEPLGSLALPPYVPVTIRLKGYVGSPNIEYIKAGYDGVSFRATPGYGKPLDVPVRSPIARPR